MKRLLITLVLIASLGMLHQHARASHIAALDLSLTCIGGNDYIVKFVLYRDCSGINAPSTVKLPFTCSSNSAYNFTLNSIPLLAGSGQEITPGCSAMPTRCMGGTLYGIREYVYQAQVTLPPCNFWKVSWSVCCRNPSNTITNATSASAYIEATINNLNAPSNSSPTFTNKPVTVMCVQQTNCYNHGAYDPDGDSLSYSMVTPFNSSATTYVNWVFPYTATQPLPSNPPVTIDPVTGDICMTPTMNIVSPMAVKVEEWRTINGTPTIIGTIYRDLQVNVVTCNNHIPKLSGMDTTMINGYNPNDTTFFLEMCLGTKVEFAIWGHDSDIYNPAVIGNPEKFSITWNNGIPQGTFQTYYQGTDSAKATFTWTPNASHVSNTPKCFTATITDQACPYFGSQTFSYCVTVRGMSVDIGKDTLLCKGESVTFKAVADTTTVNYIWKLDGIPTGVPLSSTSYTLNTTNLTAGIHIVSIETNDGGTTVKCPGIDQLTVTVVPLPKPNLGKDTLLCEPGSIILDAGPGVLYTWSTGATSRTIQASSSGTYVVFVDGGNNTRCTGTDEITIEVVPIPIVNLGPDTCVTAPITIDCNVDNAYYTWSNGANTKTITLSQSGVYSITVTLKPGSGCDADDSKVVNVIENLNLGPDTTICTHESVTLTAPIAPTGHSYKYFWLPDGQTTNFITVKDKPVGTYIYSVDVGGGCTDEVTVTIEYCAINIPNIFTPNGDGINDNFAIDGIDNYPGSTIMIYNRWGQKVFKSDSYTNAKAWGARKNSDGIYFYILYLNDGKETVHHGSVTVLSK